MINVFVLLTFILTSTCQHSRLFDEQFINLRPDSHNTLTLLRNRPNHKLYTELFQTENCGEDPLDDHKCNEDELNLCMVKPLNKAVPNYALKSIYVTRYDRTLAPETSLSM
ncbi:hypothetical protein CLF_110093 [Clonorchis sinensis]|uniref:Uncharacterized protein n=1 Tax=Clonorchis sinensis TaxID=79923 RepID=G7YK90_CLOSI|nr:hypothetical protein CLF_110093 [Clonorchis sinensis]